MLSDVTRAADFPSLKDRVYLNTAAEGIPPKAVIDALHQYAEDKILGMDGRKLHEAQWGAARETVAKAYGLTADEIGLCSCSSEAYNLARIALNLREGDEVVVNDLDFPSGPTPWIQPSCAATVKVWRAREGVLRLEDLEKLLTAKTRLVVVSLVSFYNGFRLAVGPVLEMVRRKSDALVSVDVTQALGRIPLELNDVDLIVSSTHKWILAAHGGGLVGVPKKRAAAWTANAGGWFNLSNAFDADRFDRVVTKPGAASFMVGMPNYAAVYAARAGLDYVLGVGVEKIDAHCRPLVAACLAGLKGLPVEVISPKDPAALAGIISFKHPEAIEVNERLRAKNIHIMSQAGRLRVAIHGYNTMGDVERMLSGLTEALGKV